MKRILPGLVCAIWLGASGGAAEAYDYPLKDPYLATVIGTPAELQPALPEKFDVAVRSLKVFPERQPPDVFWYQRELYYTLAYQEGEAPLVFLIAGTGGAFHSANMIFLQKVFWQAGYHVVCLSSPTHMNFIVTASTTSVPGDTVGDAEDLYRVMALVRQQIQERIKVSRFHLAGYSLGATQAAFVARLDEEKRLFDFGKVCLINPAVSLVSSARILDGMVAAALPGGPDSFDAWFQQVFRKFSEFYKIMGHQDLTHDFLYEVYRTFYQSAPPSRENLAGMIGTAFRLSAANMLFTADVMTDFGVIKPKHLELGAADSLTDYFKVSMRTSFLDYFDDLFIPFSQARQPGLTAAELHRRLSLRSIESTLRSNPRIALMLSIDDPILAPEELAFLKEVFGPRARLYPAGGHCGSMRYRENVADLVQLFRN